MKIPGLKPFILLTRFESDLGLGLVIGAAVVLSCYVFHCH